MNKFKSLLFSFYNYFYINPFNNYRFPYSPDLDFDSVLYFIAPGFSFDAEYDFPFRLFATSFGTLIFFAEFWLNLF